MATDFGSFVVGVDDSDGSRRAFEWACHQAGDGTVDAVHAFPPVASLFAASVMIDLDPVRAQHAEILEREWAMPPSWSTATVTSTIVDAEPAAALCAAAADRPDSIIVIGQSDHDRHGEHHRARHRNGHVAASVLRTADRPVVIVDSAARIGPIDEMVVVAVHGPAHANREPLEFGARLALHNDVRLHLVSVAAVETVQSGLILTYGFGADQIDAAGVGEATSDALDSLVEQLRAEWPDIDVSGTVVSGHPVTALAEAVTEVGAAIVIVGNHHHSTLVSMVTDAVLRHLPSQVTCPVAAVPVVSAAEDPVGTRVD